MGGDVMVWRKAMSVPLPNTLRTAVFYKRVEAENYLILSYSAGDCDPTVLVRPVKLGIGVVLLRTDNKTIVDKLPDSVDIDWFSEYYFTHAIKENTDLDDEMKKTILDNISYVTYRCYDKNLVVRVANEFIDVDDSKVVETAKKLLAVDFDSEVTGALLDIAAKSKNADDNRIMINDYYARELIKQKINSVVEKIIKVVRG